MSNAAAYFRYRCRWRSRVSRPGSHRSALNGSGFEIREKSLMRLGEDPRRLDLRRSARDPLQRLWTQRMQHTSTVTVTVLADVSASMGVDGGADKYNMLQQFIDSTVRSAAVCGDRFALHCADSQYLPSLSLTARRCAYLPKDLSERLREHRANGKSAEGLLRAAEKIARRRGVVFLLSDFYWPRDMIGALATALRHVQLVPVMLCGSGELRQRHSWLTVYCDAESGRQKLQLQLPWRRTVSVVAEHQAKVIEAFAALDIKVLRLEDEFDANLVSAYFYS